MSGLLIQDVVPVSIAAEVGIEPGDRLLAVNGESVADIIDFHYYGAEDELLLYIRKADGEEWELEIDRPEGEPLGLVFAPPKPCLCGNNCIFCFVHQLPAGLRSSLYVKDEDYRLSFLFGNYVTLTGLTHRDRDRIIRQKLSPLYLSVHASDPSLREILLGRKGLVPILETIGELAAAGIKMHTQVVLCPGINDGSHLIRTVNDLHAFSPAVASLAIVPVGLTQHRSSLPPLQAVNQSYARAFLDEWELRRLNLAAAGGEPFLFLADEFYLKAERPFPPLEEYGDLPQLENGVGMVSLFQADADDVIAAAKPLAPFTATVVTGTSACPFVAGFLKRLSQVCGVSFRIVPVTNRLFGESVTVAGLVAGQDIMVSLREGTCGDLLLVPDVMLKEGEMIFLDGVTIAELEDALHVPVRVFSPSPTGFYDSLTTP